MQIQTTVRSAGGSMAVTLPQKLGKAANIKPGDTVLLDWDGLHLTVTPTTRKRYTVADLIDMQGDAPLLTEPGWDDAPAAGKEVAL